MNNNRRNCINISFSTNPNLIQRINKYLTHETDIKLSQSAGVYLSKYQNDFYSIIPKGDKSIVLSRIIEKYLDKLDEKGFQNLYLSRSELIRMAITDDMLKEKKDQMMYEYFLNQFLNSFPFVPRKRKMNYNGRHILRGNIYHPNGKWIKYHDKKDLEKFQRFQIIYNKLKDYFSEKDVRDDFEKFNRLYQDGLLDVPIKNIKQLKELYDKQNEMNI